MTFLLVILISGLCFESYRHCLKLFIRNYCCTQNKQLSSFLLQNFEMKLAQSWANIHYWAHTSGRFIILEDHPWIIFNMRDYSEKNATIAMKSSFINKPKVKNPEHHTNWHTQILPHWWHIEKKIRLAYSLTFYQTVTHSDTHNGHFSAGLYFCHRL